jgi:RND family efflux transporter MFP subunit
MQTHASKAFAIACLLLTQTFAVAAEPALQSYKVALEKAPLERAFDGTIEAVNQGTVSAQTAGRVVQVMYDVNDFVPAGAVIVKLKGTEQRASLGQAEAGLKEAIAAEAEVQKRYARVQELLKEHVVSQQQVDQVSAERDAIVARLASARAGVDAAREGVNYTEVRAPYAGIVTKRHVEVGESVSPGSLLMSGLSLQFLRVTVDLPQSVVEKVRGTRKAAIYVNGKRVEAKKITIFPEASAQSNTFKTRVDLPENATDLYPGMFVKVSFVTGESERLLIPASALVERSEITAVYVIDAQGATTLRQVRLGHRFDQRIEVLAGLKVGETIALDPIVAAAHLKPTASGAHE